MKNIDKEFKQWKMKKLNEGFLDDSPETTTPSAENTESIVQSYEAPEETATEPTELENTTDENDDDITQSPVEEKPAEETEELENTEAEEKTDTEDVKTEISSIKDAIAALASQIQTLVDQKNQEEAPAEETTEEMSEPTEGEGEGSSEGEGEESTEGEGEGSSEGEGEESTEGEGEGSSEDEGEGEEEGGDDSITQTPEGETVTDAYKFNLKKGNILNSKSGSIISKVAHQRLWELDEKIMSVIEAKIRRQINEAKKEIKAKIVK